MVPATQRDEPATLLKLTSISKGFPESAHCTEFLWKLRRGEILGLMERTEPARVP